MKPCVVLGDIIDGEENCTSSGVSSSDNVRLWWWEDGVDEGCVVGAIYCYNKGRLVVSEKGDDCVVGCGECVG